MALAWFFKMFYWFDNVKIDTILRSAQDVKILTTDKQLYSTVSATKLPFWEDIMKGKCVYTSTLKKRLIRKRSKRTWMIFQRLTKWTDQWGSQTHSPPRLPGSLEELNPLMKYYTPLTIITWEGQKSLCYWHSENWKSKGGFWDLSLSSTEADLLVGGTDSPGIIPKGQVIKQKSGRRIRPADQCVSSTTALVSDITEGQ